MSLGNRPPQDFEDPRLKGKVNKADFKSILDIAVLCVAKSSEGRPNIDVVCNELEKAWRNTNDYKVCFGFRPFCIAVPSPKIFSLIFYSFLII